MRHIPTSRLFLYTSITSLAAFQTAFIAAYLCGIPSEGLGICWLISLVVLLIAAGSCTT